MLQSLYIICCKLKLQNNASKGLALQVYSKILFYWNETWCISDDVYNQAVVVVAGLLTNRRKLTFHWLLETDRLRAAEAKVPM